MTDQRISDLTLATLPLVGTEEVPLRVGSANRRVAVRHLRRPGIPILPGVDYTHNQLDGSFTPNQANIAINAGTLTLWPWVPLRDCRTASIGVRVLTAAALGGLARIGLWASDDAGLPDTLLGSVSNLPIDAPGTPTGSMDVTIRGNGLYWWGINANQAGAQYRGLGPAGLLTVGAAPASLFGTDGTAYRQTLAYGDPLTVAALAATQILSLNLPLILLNLQPI
jgi:hypothetical protein